MIVVAIIGILAAVAIPAYQDYIVKAKLAKVMSTMDPVKTALAAYFSEYGGFPQLGVALNPVTFAMSSTPLGTVAGTDVWSSVGFTTYPTLPKEVFSMAYVIVPPVAPSVVGATGALTLVIANVKSALPAAGGIAIDASMVTMSPSVGVSFDGIIPVTATAAGTSLVWRYACNTTDVVALKGFNNSGTLCQNLTQ